MTTEPLDVAAHTAAVADLAAGAVVTFTGVVRNQDRGRAVVSLRYEAHPTAARVLGLIVAEIVAESDCEAVAVTHRVGELAVGEIAVVVAVSAAHRQSAFATASLILEEVKHRIPVWKQQRFHDGGQEWLSPL